MSIQIQLSGAKNYLLGFATSGAILFSSFLYYNHSQQPSDTGTFKNEEFTSPEKTQLYEFDPNELDADGWKKLGFTDKKIATIFKYKEVVGGSFASKEQLKKCYAISDEKFAELESYILLPETSVSTFKNYSSKNYGGNNYSSNYANTYKTNKKGLVISGKFNPDNFSTDDFVKMGFSENQANSILKYKSYLGGSFISKEKFKACYMISDENYRKMEPYLLLPENAAQKSGNQFSFANAKVEKPAINYQKFDPNTTDLESWKQLGFSEKQAQVIINYRDKNLRGSFKSLEDIEKCFVISKEKFEEMKPFIVLNPENMKAIVSKKYDENPASKNTSSEEKTNFSTVDLNQITFKQLEEFGFDEKSAAMLLSFRKKLGGFVSRQQIIDTYEIDKNLAQKLVNIARLDARKVEIYTLASAPEEWLKNHPYFKYSAEKIIYFRITNPKDKKIWKFLKVKPEYEARMKLYLKDE